MLCNLRSYNLFSYNYNLIQRLERGILGVPGVAVLHHAARGHTLEPGRAQSLATVQVTLQKVSHATPVLVVSIFSGHGH